MNNVKEINVKNRIQYFLDDMITIIYHTGYVTVKDLSYATINSVNPLYLIINKINGYLEEIMKISI